MFLHSDQSGGLTCKSPHVLGIHKVHLRVKMCLKICSKKEAVGLRKGLRELDSLVNSNFTPEISIRTIDSLQPGQICVKNARPGAKTLLE